MLKKFLIIFLLVLLPVFCYAEVKQYTPLVDGFGLNSNSSGNATGLGAFFNQAFTLFIGLLGIFAVLLIIAGGLQYVSTDAWGSKDSGKKKIQAALGGLAIALLSYVILNTIDPGLTEFNFTVKPIEGLKKAGPGLISDGVSASYSNGGINGSAVVGGSDTPTADGNGGYTITPRYSSLDTDGRTNPGWDPTYQPRTSYKRNGQYLDAFIDDYVVVPEQYQNLLGKSVTVTNNDTGATYTAIVGDIGPNFGEVSAALASKLGIWDQNMKNSINNPKKGLTFVFSGN